MKMHLRDRYNMVYSGCSVTYGHAVAMVTATGMQRRWENRRFIGICRRYYNLTAKLAKLGQYLGFAAIVARLIFAIGLLAKMEILKIL